MPSFNFFKKKDKDISKLNNKKSGAGAVLQIQQYL